MKTQSEITKARIVIRSARRGTDLLKRLNVFPWTAFSAERYEEFFTPMIMLLSLVVETKTLPKKEHREALVLLRSYENLDFTFRPGSFKNSNS